jgi:predicted DNA binding CopG/RHH family protein
MASKDKIEAQIQSVDKPDATNSQNSSSELEDELEICPTKDTTFEEAPSLLLNRTSARQAAQKSSETQLVTGLLLEGSLTAPISSRITAKAAPIRSSTLLPKPIYKSASAIANKATLLAKTVPNKKAQITSYMQASPRKPIATLDPTFGLPVGTVKAIQIATQLAPHIATATTSSEYDSRLREALADMQQQLDQQRLQAELEKDKSDALAALLQSTHQQKLMQEHLSLEAQDKLQAKHLLVEAEWTSIHAQLLQSNKDLEETLEAQRTSRSQPIQVPSVSAPRLDQLSSSTKPLTPILLSSPAPQTLLETSSDRQLLEVEAYKAFLQQHLHSLVHQTSLTPAKSATLAQASASAPHLPGLASVPAKGSQSSKIRSISASVPAQSLPAATSAAPIISSSAAPTHLSAKAQAEFQKQQIIIAHAQRRQTSLTQPGSITARRTSREKEKDLAILTNDKELLKGSVRIKKETLSDDDSDDVASEQGDAIACHNLLYPKAKVSTRNSIGYVNSAFIKPDDEDDSDSDHEDSDEEDEQDDDPSPNYDDDSVERDAERKELQTLRATRSAHVAEIAQLRKEASERQQAELQELRLFRTSTLMMQTAPAQATSFGRPQAPLSSGKLQVALNPPAHGKWDDVAHLMKTYLPAYEKYMASCGPSAETIFSAYTLTEKKRLSKLFTKRTVQGEVTLDISIEHLLGLTNAEFLEMICKEKGYKTSTLTEDALRAIQWSGSFTEKANWINHETNWEECLAQTSAKGEINKKRLITLFRESIPEPFIQKHLASKRFDTWQQANLYMAEDQIKNSDFLIEWNEHIRTRKPAMQPRQKQHFEGTAAAAEPAMPPVTVITAGGSDPLTYSNSFGSKNVNPNLIIDLDMNKSKVQCDRCPAPKVHRWPSSMCTAYKTSKGDIINPRLSHEETTSRKILRWNAGFFMTENPTTPRPPPRHSPSVTDAAAATSATNKALGNTN